MIEKLLKTLIEPLVEHQDAVYIKQFEEDVDGYVIYEVMVHQEDIGRVIGKRGSVAQSIRKICYAAAMRNNQRIRINFDHF